MVQSRHLKARWLFGWAILTLLLPSQSLVQSHSGFPGGHCRWPCAPACDGRRQGASAV